MTAAPIFLTPTQRAIWSRLRASPGEWVSVEALVRATHPKEHFVADDVARLRTHICNLRQSLGEHAEIAGTAGMYRESGYRLVRYDGHPVSSRQFARYGNRHYEVLTVDTSGAFAPVAEAVAS